MFGEVAELKCVLLVTGLLLVGTACTTRNPRNCDDGICTDPAFPYCDADGSVGGTPHVCIEATCEAGVIVGCQGNGLLRCNADGSDYEVVACANGCDSANARCNDCVPTTAMCSGGALMTCGASGTIESTESCLAGCLAAPQPHCAFLEPKYLPDSCEAFSSTQSLEITSSGMFDTNLSANCTGGVIAQTGAAELCVVKYRSIRIAAGSALKVTGSRALVLLANHDLEVAGTLDVSADGITSGPGVVTPSGAAADPLVANPKGGGGSGFKTNGASAGTTTSTGGAGNGGAAMSDPAALTALVGGTKAGGVMMSASGGGGGAAALISCRGKVEVSGTLHAGGGGGLGGVLAPLGIRIPGWGGGSGGYVVIQGPSVIVTGGVFANGGGGGGGLRANDTTGVAGEDGPAAATSAMGGAATNGEGPGGSGAWRDGGAQPGGMNTAAGALPGGGGGGMGWFQAYVPTAGTATLTPAEASPAFQPTGTARIR
jgi:hypothetical protein